MRKAMIALALFGTLTTSLSCTPDKSEDQFYENSKEIDKDSSDKDEEVDKD